MSGTPLRPDTYAQALTTTVPEISQIATIDTEIVASLDSSDIGSEHWETLATRITNSRQDYNGFVVVHGTDTMAWTASALSFALQNLDRPVILTGAQRPLSALRTDARRNLIDAVEIATLPIPEVAICFDGLLLRGCRATKSHALMYRAFDSPDCEPLARLGVDVALAEHIRSPSRDFQSFEKFQDDVVTLYMTPGLSPGAMESFLSTGVRGLVLAAYGLGTVPRLRRDFASVVRQGIDHGVPIVVVSQTAGKVDLSLYDNSRVLEDAGAISGGSMRIEAATTKLMHALANYPSLEEIRHVLTEDIAGELG